MIRPSHEHDIKLSDVDTQYTRFLISQLSSIVCLRPSVLLLSRTIVIEILP